MKKKIFLIIVLLILLVGAGTTTYLNSAVDAKSTEKVSFSITQNEQSDAILNRLKEAGLIKSTLYAKVYLKISNKTDFKAGVFELSKSQSTDKIIKTLNNSSNVMAHTVTFVEGKRIIDYAKQVEETLGIKEQDFLDACNDVEFIKSLKPTNQLLKEYNFTAKGKYFLEGLLAPDTYNIPKGATAKDVITVMLTQANKIYLENKALFDKSKLSLREIYTLASMVEAEAKTYDDRVIVASIFMNRIKSDMTLGSDVTTYYGLQIDMASRDLTTAELKEKNGYNTRAIEGLPVTAINSPSTDAIKAALSYTSTDYLYFVSDKNGKIYATKTYAEHNKVIEDLKSKNLWFEY